MNASLKRLASAKDVSKTIAEFASDQMKNVLSLFANRIARVCASGSPSLTSAAAFQTQLRSLPTLGESFISGTTTICIRFARSRGSGVVDRINRSIGSEARTVVVCADFERFVTSHHQSSFLVFLVLQ